MAREDLHFRLRIPSDLKEKVEKAAAQNKRSMTAEMVARIEWTFYETFRGDHNRTAVLKAILEELHEAEFQLHEISDEVLAAEVARREAKKK